MTTIAERLGAFARDTVAIPEAARDSVVKCVFDLTTAAIAGYRTPNAHAVREVAPDIWGSGPSSIWLSGRRTTLAGAAFVNAACACSLDLDDGHRTAAGHPGAAVIPAIFAATDAVQFDTERVLVAIAVGYDVGVRISAARDLKNVPTTNSGLWGGQAAAAAVGALWGLSPLQIGHAIAIAGTTAPNQAVTAYTRHRGNSVKEGISWAAANGVLAASLAARGFTGPIDILDEPGRFSAEALLDGLGTRWHVEGTYFKPYSCCRWNHAPIDALLSLQATHKFAAQDIAAIEVETFSRALTLANEPAPSTLEGAQYSIPFCLGVAVAHGASALLPLRDESLTDALAVGVARRVTMAVTPEFDAMFPAAVPGRVRVTTGAGIFEQEVLLPKGEPANPMDWADLEEKFQNIASGRIARSAAERLRSAIEALRNGEIGPIASVLAAAAFPEVS